MIYVFGDCELDTCLYTLQRAGQTNRLRPKVFGVCLYLLEHRDRVVSREELGAQVWPGQFISHATLEGVIRAVRQAAGDSGQAQGIIQTLHGYGYRFVAGVEERATQGAGREVQLASALRVLPEASAPGQTDVPTPSVGSAETPEEPPVPVQHGATTRDAAGQPENSADVSAPIDRGERLTSSQRTHRVVQALAALTLIMLAAWALWWWVRPEATVPLDKSRIAVLPFVNLSPEADNSYFADGMTEELIFQLSKVRALTVIARTSVMKYKGTLKDVATIGRELRVGTILEGSVRQADNHVRINAQLVDVASQGHLWSQEYDRELREVFEVQSDIATSVAQRLKVQLTAGEKRRIEKQGTGNLEAYTLYLQGRYYRNMWTEESLRKAVAYFEQAIDRDPTYALAYAGIADAYLLLPFFSATTAPMEVYPRVMAAVEQALQHGESFGAVQTTVASAKLWYAWDWAGAEDAFKQALALSPNDAATHRRYAWYLMTRGRLKDAIAVMHRAQELNPVSPGITRNVGLAFYFARQYDQAITQFRTSLKLDPNFRTAYSGLVYAYLQKGMYAEALAACEQMLDRWGRTPWVLWDLGYASAVSGQRSQARQVLAELQERAQHAYVRPLASAWISIGLDEKDAAFAWLEKAYADRDPYLTLLNADPVYDPLRADPRFTALLKNIGLRR
ncbi:MAG: tetratricopeptide repeat protein [Nitrospinae bacterium]|nr:tetratricopeptide repeat protein [Nitrospinota bacterium]